MKFREHRGALDDSMATCVELADRSALVEHIRKIAVVNLHPGIEIVEEQIVIRPYVMTPDTRIGWNATYMVSILGIGPIGFTDSTT